MPAEEFTGKSARAKKHIAEMQNRYSDRIQSSIQKTDTYDESSTFALPSPRYAKTRITVKPMDAVSAVLYAKNQKENGIEAKPNEKTAVLNFASFKSAGGGYVNGAHAQEESLCEESTLYNVLSAFDKTYYERNRNESCSALYLDRALYSPDVVFHRKSEEATADVITCAAPNYRAASKNSVSRKENEEALMNRFRFILDIAASHAVDNLILGAFGCGVFGQDATETASIWKSLLTGDYDGQFKSVTFAVPYGPFNGNYISFAQTIFCKEATMAYYQMRQY